MDSMPMQAPPHWPVIARQRRAHVAVDEAQRRLVLDRVVGEAGALAVHVDRVAVEVGLRRRRIEQVAADAAAAQAGAPAPIWPACVVASASPRGRCRSPPAASWRNPCRGRRSPACRRWRCCSRSGAGAPSAGSSAWAWKSSESVNRLIIASLGVGARRRGPGWDGADVTGLSGAPAAALARIGPPFPACSLPRRHRRAPTVRTCCRSPCSLRSRASRRAPSPVLTSGAHRPALAVAPARRTRSEAAAPTAPALADQVRLLALDKASAPRTRPASRS